MTARTRAKLPGVARRLIEQLIAAVDDELYATGPAEVRRHLTLRAKYRLCDRARRYLEKTP